MVHNHLLEYQEVQANTNHLLKDIRKIVEKHANLVGQEVIEYLEEMKERTKDQVTTCLIVEDLLERTQNEGKLDFVVLGAFVDKMNEKINDLLVQCMLQKMSCPTCGPC